MYLMTNEKSIPIKIANNFCKKLIGLMGQKDINYGMIFPHTNSIHTFFMKENIDVIALNADNEVIFKCENVPINKIINVKNNIKNTSILELPAYASKQIKIGDKLTFISE